jgi:hypothetical protein
MEFIQKNRLDTLEKLEELKDKNKKLWSDSITFPMYNRIT